MLTILQHRILKKVLTHKASLAGRGLTELYFGYGANIDPDFFKKRITSFNYVGIGKLVNYAFKFNTPCEYHLKGYGGVEKLDGQNVYGSLYQISSETLELLDCLEWVPFHFYRREILPIRLEDGTTVNAHVYIPNFPRKGLYPPKGYQNLLVNGAKKLGYPQEYINYLSSHESREKFVIDNKFNLRNPGLNRALPSKFYHYHDILREKLCDLI